MKEKSLQLNHSLRLRAVGVIVAIAVMLVAVFGFYRADRASYLRQLEKEHNDDLQFSEELIRTNFGFVVDDLLIVSRSTALREFIAEPTPSNRLRLARAMRNLSVNKRQYAQVRFLNAEGEEIVRVDSGGQIIAEEGLQDKSRRYYVTEGTQVPAGAIYISPIDLNVENDEVELPYAPTIRFVLPIDDPILGRVGVVVLNYRASQLLSRLREMGNRRLSNVKLMNADGFWLLHPDREKEWGFMFAAKQGLSLAEVQPTQWETISKQPMGLLVHDEGALFWRRISIQNSIEKLHSKPTNYSDEFWIMGIDYSESAWASLFEPIRQKYLFLSAVPTLIGLIVIAYLFTRERHRRTIDEIHELNTSILQNAQVAVVTTDTDGTITSFNEFAEKMSGWPGSKLIQKESVLLFYEPFQLEARAEEISEKYGQKINPDFEVFSAAATRKGRDIREWIFSRNDGIKLPVISAVSLIRDAAGATTGYLFVMVDISKQKSVEKRLLEAREEAEALAKMKSQFLANMSHEIRTPMNGVIGLANLLINDELNPEQRMMMETLVTSADTLMVVINDILDFSKIEAGALAIEESPFDLRESIDTTLKLFAPEADAKGIELINKTEPNIDFALLGDSHRVIQILSNLVGNAVKFTSQGEIVIAANSSRVSEQDVSVFFEVSDTGIGMDAKAQEEVFKPFTQADAGTTRKFGGTGLGLAITTKLVTMMGGTIKVRSEVGQGTTFYVELPFRLDTDNVFKPILEKGTFREKRALIVDDNLTNLLVLKGQLSNLGFQVNTFEDSKSAYLEFANHPEYDLLILDYLMPEMDGLGLARQLTDLRKGANSKLVILSSSQAIIDQSDRLAASVDAYLTKPVSQKELYSVLKEFYIGGALIEPIDKNSAAALKQRLQLKSQGRPLRIIMADDDETNRMVIKLQLRSLGFDVDMVDNGEDLLKQIKEVPYDLVLMDCNMPGIDGYEATRYIRANESEGIFASEHFSIIAVTAFALEEDRDKCLAVGMNDYVSKPTRLPELAQALERAIVGF